VSEKRDKLDEIKQLAEKLVNLLPSDLGETKDGLEKKFTGLIQITLSKMNIVTREEFDVQMAVLRRTREKLEAIEARLASDNKQT
jgi:BMFP domain-containing protein YqiC